MTQRSKVKLPKMDACIWTKNGGNIIPKCLDRFNAVVPQEDIHRKIMIDDHSVDDTQSVGEIQGREVYMNSGNGIADAANQALSLVSTDFFIALEQDMCSVYPYRELVQFVLQVNSC